MKIYLNCKGRLGNQLVSWAHARHTIEKLGLHDRIIVVNYRIAPNSIILPGAIVDTEYFGTDLPKATRHSLSECQSDCLWVWEDLYYNLPEIGLLNEQLLKIEVHHGFDQELLAAVGYRKTIGVHVRCGDFFVPDKNHKIGELFVRYPERHFIKHIEECMSAFPGSSIFLASDGMPEELAFLTSKYPVIQGRKEDDVFDLFALSRCRVLVGSDSTFSRCAQTLGGVPMITHRETDAAISTMLGSIK